MSIKTVLALLNSELFSFLYQKLFGEVKILKGNLLCLPFPAIPGETDVRISASVDRILCGETGIESVLQREICALFALDDTETEYIHSCLK